MNYSWIVREYTYFSLSPKRDFIDLLKHHGLLADFDEIYISADQLATKGSGKLYDTVLNDMKCSPDKIMMIGDNLHADIKVAKEKGIQTFFIDRSEIKETYQTWLKENCIEKRKHGLERKMRHTIDYIAGRIFPEMGTSLWFFIHQNGCW